MYNVAGNMIEADNAFDAAQQHLNRRGLGYCIPARIGHLWKAHKREGARLVPVGNAFKVS